MKGDKYEMTKEKTGCTKNSHFDDKECSAVCNMAKGTR
jgi:hypothetical protein